MPKMRHVIFDPMSKLIDHLTRLTGLRDRDTLDVTLASALADLLHPRCVAVYRSVGDSHDQHWTTRARLDLGDAVASADSAWADLADLPRLTDHPLRCDALARQATVCGGPNDGVSVFPLMSDRETVGVVEVITDAPLDASALGMVSSVLRIFHNFQSLLDYSERDTLTGLLNRKTFDDSFFKLMQRLPPGAKAGDDRRCAEPALAHTWLAMVDIDFFKSVNDTHGHLIGDEVLLLLSRLMRNTLRFHDRLYRFGGEEFVIVMRCDTEPHAAAVLERVRRNTEAFAFPQVGRMTISAGFTLIMPTDSPASALDRADRAVYHAKGQGRNQVCSHAVLAAAGQPPQADKVGDFELF